ncbi:hypothetical protein CI807_13755 [Pseudomonas sp. NS1(2017)]|uniref:M91 family zinc metallopeptidase n=1 Tax=Pseudomonas sp. NS1(2017) TaxID=2025658 RepID=UPI000BA275C0|nr:M91 family zinc metallopeptidase [Pseudomonas sp. NS1(2017)]ASV37206.1 hypothetical protein CI807_13755 [Pseudomonas sp. NS1(2017)]
MMLTQRVSTLPPHPIKLQEPKQATQQTLKNNPAPPVAIDGNKRTYVDPDYIENQNKLNAKSNKPLIPSHYAGKSRLTTDQRPFSTTRIEYNPLYSDSNVDITRERTVRYPEDKRFSNQLTNDALVIKTGNNADIVHISKGKDGTLNVQVNDQTYSIKPSEERRTNQKIVIQTQGGDDTVKIDDDVDYEIIVEGGDGDDDITAGGGTTRIFGGAGNDTIRLGRGTGYAEGNDGDDCIYAGRGKGVLYGNNGNDRLIGYVGPDANPVYMDGGAGNDSISGGSAHSVMNGGLGDDTLKGIGRSTFYAGDGKDSIISENVEDLIYAKPTDLIQKKTEATFIPIVYENVGKTGIKIEGSPEFKQRVEDDLEMLRASPSGQQMLKEFDASTNNIGVPLNIIEVESEDNSFYMGRNSHFDQKVKDGIEPHSAEDPDLGVIKNGVRGTPLTHGALQYNRSYVNNGTHKNHPVSYLYHEMSHAYNGRNGTVLPGTTENEANIERQAVGLPTDATPFDFDNDPATPPTDTNPDPFNENALHQEMGESLRTRYFD